MKNECGEYAYCGCNECLNEMSVVNVMSAVSLLSVMSVIRLSGVVKFKCRPKMCDPYLDLNLRPHVHIVSKHSTTVKSLVKVACFFGVLTNLKCLTQKFVKSYWQFQSSTKTNPPYQLIK